jgi:hypothetical protein
LLRIIDLRDLVRRRISKDSLSCSFLLCCFPPGLCACDVLLQLGANAFQLGSFSLNGLFAFLLLLDRLNDKRRQGNVPYQDCRYHNALGREKITQSRRQCGLQCFLCGFLKKVLRARNAFALLPKQGSQFRNQVDPNSGNLVASLLQNLRCHLSVDPVLHADIKFGL